MMTPFWLTLAILLLVASAFMLWPLRRMRSRDALTSEEVQTRTETNVRLYRERMVELEEARASGSISQDAFEQLKLEQDRALLDDEQRLAAGAHQTSGRLGARLLIAACVLSAITAVVLYQQLGSIQDVRLVEMHKEKTRQDWEDMRNQREPDPARTRQMINAIEARLDQQPDNSQYRFLLGRYAMSIGDYDRAVEAYETLLARQPDSARVMAELGQALFLSQGNRITSRIADLAHGALNLEPHETTALGLAGINAFNQGDFQAAIDYWQRAVDELGPNAPESKSLQAGIARARDELPDSTDESPVPEVSVTVHVSVSERAKLDPDKTVFVYARAWEGSPMPLAITQVQVADLPATITLDDTMAMTANAALSQESQVELIARASLTASARPQSGDWQGSVGPVEPVESGDVIDLTIDQKITE